MPSLVHWEMTSEERAQEIPYWWRMGSASDCGKINQKQYPDLGSEASSDVISRGRQWRRREMSAVFWGNNKMQLRSIIREFLRFLPKLKKIQTLRTQVSLIKSREKNMFYA